jgi:pilus assembly protein Flp/PilA
MSFVQTLTRFRKSRGGTTAIEYGLLAALLSIVIIVSLTTIGTEMNDTFFGPIGNTLSTAQTN